MIIASLSFLCMIAGCGNQGKNKNAVEVDSMLTIVYHIQDTISSASVQVLHEIRQTLSNDLSLIYDSMYKEVINSNVTTRYSSLYSSVESCVLACNNYHEEIFMMENELRELLVLINDSELPGDSLELKIQYEADLLHDMHIRIDTNVGKIARHIKSFNELKPRMDSLIIQSGIEIQVP